MNVGFVLIIVGLCHVGLVQSCGYSSCQELDPDMLNLHIVPHSHDDVGWMKTANDYYMDSVRHIITNVVAELSKDSSRRFTQVEMYYFHRWWNEQNSTTKNKVSELVRNGQLVFSGGGWVVNDEGVALYSDIIDQMTLGHRFLYEEFTECGIPKISWQVDAFGHSKEMASLIGQMGFDGHVINRAIDPKGEFVWTGSDDLTSKSEVFSSTLHHHYHAPDGFDFENVNNKIDENNKNSKADQFVSVARKWNEDYNRTNHVLMTMGADMAYVHADNWYTNIDKLIETINARHEDVNAFYSNPNCYFYALNDLERTFDVRERDYLNLWVGYYTSRPALKRAARVVNNLMQAAKQLSVLAKLNVANSEPFLNEASNEEAILQHHDAITGTSPQNTADDYAMRLYSSLLATYPILEKSIQKITNITDKIHFCHTLNITQCQFTEENENFAIHLYNPLVRSVEDYVRIPVSSDQYSVYDPQGKTIESFVVPTATFLSRLTLKNQREASKFELVFKAQMKDLSVSTYLAKKKPKETKTFSKQKETSTELKGKGFKVNLNSATGQIESIELNNGVKHRLEQKLMFYKPVAQYNNMEESGAYQFCPNGEAKEIGESNKTKIIASYSNGPLHEVHQEWDSYAHQTIRTYEDKEYIEFDWVVNIPLIDDHTGREIIIRFESDLDNDNVFYTDANGRQMVRRVYDHQRKSCSNEDIPANWYPIYTKAFIRDKNSSLQLSVLNDRSQGGSSLSKGQLELMIHRRLKRPGPGGSFELNEVDSDNNGLVIRGKHYLYINSVEESMEIIREHSQQLILYPEIAFSSFDGKVDDYIHHFKTNVELSDYKFPSNVHLLNLEHFGDNKILLRIEHFYQKEDQLKNKKLLDPVLVEIWKLFPNLIILDGKETYLNGITSLKEDKLVWKSNSTKNHDENNDALFEVLLRPQQIRTFVLAIDEGDNDKAKKCNYSWSLIENSVIPSHAFKAGFDESNVTLYVCRAKYENETLVGKANSLIKCRLSFGGKEIKVDTGFEVLTDCDNSQWIPGHEGDSVPKGAIVAGASSINEPIYIGRCAVHGEQVGKIHHKFYYPYDQHEYNCHNHEILICL